MGLILPTVFVGNVKRQNLREFLSLIIVVDKFLHRKLSVNKEVTNLPLLSISPVAVHLQLAVRKNRIESSLRRGHNKGVTWRLPENTLVKQVLTSRAKEF